jgi:general secretion pathway protein D
MLFLRPVVMRDAAASDSLSQSRYDQMRAMQIGTQPPADKTAPATPERDVPVLP